MKTLNILDTGRHYGNMNTAKAFYPKNLPAEYRKSDFLARRILLGEEKGFDGHRMYMADQKDRKGTYHILNEDDIASKEDSWDLSIREDIIVITDQMPGVVAGHPVADCPVVMVSDRKNGVTAVCHCSAELVDKKLPLLTAEALRSAEKKLNIDTYDENIWAYVSACAGSNWEYNCYPTWAQDENVWKNGGIIERDKDIFNINIRKPILDQLEAGGVNDVRLKLVDTITHPDYYSNCAARKDPTKAGRQFIGAFYPYPTSQEQARKILTLKNI